MFQRENNTVGIRKARLKKYLLNHIGEMIISPKGKKELIDLVNKHIEHSYNDSIPRIGNNISNIALAGTINALLSLNNKSFNKDLATLMFRYGNQKQSNADGLYSGFEDINESFNTISEVSEKSTQEIKNNEDEIKLALINKGIKKKNLIGKNVLLFFLILAIAVLIIWLLVKFGGNKEISSAPANIGAPDLIE
jgi:hypothetical protein